MEVPGTQPRGRPKKRWRDTINEDLIYAEPNSRRRTPVIDQNGDVPTATLTPRLAGEGEEDDDDLSSFSIISLGQSIIKCETLVIVL